MNPKALLTNRFLLLTNIFILAVYILCLHIIFGNSFAGYIANKFVI